MSHLFLCIDGFHVHGRALCHTLCALRPLLKPPLEHWPPKVRQPATATPLARVIVPNSLAQPGLLLGSRPSLPTTLLRVFTHSRSFGGGTHLLDQVSLERKVRVICGESFTCGSTQLLNSWWVQLWPIVADSKVVAKRSAGSDDIEDGPARSAMLLSTALPRPSWEGSKTRFRRLPSEPFSKHLAPAGTFRNLLRVWQRVLSACNWGRWLSDVSNDGMRRPM